MYVVVTKGKFLFSLKTPIGIDWSQKRFGFISFWGNSGPVL